MLKIGDAVIVNDGSMYSGRDAEIVELHQWGVRVRLQHNGQELNLKAGEYKRDAGLKYYH